MQPQQHRSGAENLVRSRGAHVSAWHGTPHAAPFPGSASRAPRELRRWCCAGVPDSVSGGSYSALRPPAGRQVAGALVMVGGSGSAPALLPLREGRVHPLLRAVVAPRVCMNDAGYPDLRAILG